MVGDKFPGANINQEVDPNAGEGTFDVMMEGEKIYS